MSRTYSLIAGTRSYRDSSTVPAFLIIAVLFLICLFVSVVEYIFFKIGIDLGLKKYIHLAFTSVAILFVIWLFYHLIFYKQISIKRQILRGFIDTATINTRKLNRDSFIVPSISVAKIDKRNFKVIVELLPNMDTDLAKTIQFINASLKGWNRNLVVKNSLISENQTNITYFLNDIRDITAMKPKKVNDLKPKNNGIFLLMSNTEWDISKTPHALVSGKTGAGKTTFLYGLLYQFFQVKAVVRIIDPKDEFMALQFLGGSIFNTKEGALNALKQAVDELNNRQQVLLKEIQKRRNIGLNGASLGLSPYFLIIDELASLLATMTKSEKDEFNSYLLQLILKGRSSLMNIILTSQQANSKTISTEIRDNLGLRVLLGSASLESRKMVFGDKYEVVPSSVPNFEGYFELLGITNEPQKLKITDLRQGGLNTLDSLEKAYYSTFNE